MYCDPNFKTKKALGEAVKEGRQVSVFQPGGFFPGETDGEVSLEGPHYPEPHTWYARALIKDGVILKILA